MQISLLYDYARVWVVKGLKRCFLIIKHIFTAHLLFRKLYWSDIRLEHIVEANYDGTDARIIQVIDVGDADYSPLAIDENGMVLQLGVVICMALKRLLSVYSL